MIGIDEVGRGAWAGPLLVCAARLKAGHVTPPGLTDSKLLTRNQREKLFQDIVTRYDLSEAWVSASMIDLLGLGPSLKSACLFAAFQITNNSSEAIILDGSVNYFKGSKYLNVSTLPKADATVSEVSAASIYAKVMRDKYMKDLSIQFEQYGFESHVGYGTEAHRVALLVHGPISEHRLSIKPLRKYSNEYN